jgi:hypothetical protein
MPWGEGERIKYRICYLTIHTIHTALGNRLLMGCRGVDLDCAIIVCGKYANIAAGAWPSKARKKSRAGSSLLAPQLKQRPIVF